MLAEPNISRELGMAGMLALGASRSYVPDYLKMDMNIDSQTFNFTVAVENEDEGMPSGATAVAGAGLIGAMAIPYLMNSTDGLGDMFGTDGLTSQPAQFDSPPTPDPTPVGSIPAADGKENATK